MTETLVQGLIHALRGSMGKEAIVFIISMIPIVELTCCRTNSRCAGSRGDSAFNYWKYRAGAFYSASDYTDLCMDERNEEAETTGGKAGSKSNEQKRSDREI